MPTFIDLPEKIAAGLTESTKEVFADVSHTVIGLLDQLFYCFESQRVRGRAETGYLRLRSMEYDPKWEFHLFVDTNDLSL